MMITRQMAEEAAALLGLKIEYVGAQPVKLDEQDINKRYRELVKLCHPDQGGDAEKFVAIDRAKCLLVQWTNRPSVGRLRVEEVPEMPTKTCPMCHGEGRRRLSRGFNTMTMVCGTCRGAGEIVEREKDEQT